MSYYMAINKSGKNLPVFSGWPSSDKGSQIGTIYDREVFCYSDTEDGYEIYFRNSSGRVVQGFYYATDKNGNDLFPSHAAAMEALSPCTDYPYSTATIGGKRYYTFKFRRREEVYTAAGSSWGAVASGMEVACLTDAMGDMESLQMLPGSRGEGHEPIKKNGIHHCPGCPGDHYENRSAGLY